MVQAFQVAVDAGKEHQFPARKEYIYLPPPRHLLPTISLIAPGGNGALMKRALARIVWEEV